MERWKCKQCGKPDPHHLYQWGLCMKCFKNQDKPKPTTVDAQLDSLEQTGRWLSRRRPMDSNQIAEIIHATSKKYRNAPVGLFPDLIDAFADYFATCDCSARQPDQFYHSLSCNKNEFDKAEFLRIATGG